MNALKKLQTRPQSAENEIISDDTEKEEKEGEDLIGPCIPESLTMLDQVCKCPSSDEKGLAVLGK